MVRCGLILFLAMLVVTQVTCSKDEDNEDVETTSNPTSNDEDESDEEEVSSRQPSEPSTTAARMTRTTSINLLQCFVCSYKRDSSQWHCLDPLRHNVSSMYCRTPGDKCFTAVDKRESGVSIVVRGCKSNCISAPDITCCEMDSCNSQPVIDRPTHLQTASLSAAAKSLPQTILYFVTVLLLLKAVVQVNIV